MENFKQLCVWPSTVVGKENVKSFEDWMFETFGVRAKYDCEVKTLPDIENGRVVPETGGRNDLFFYIHNEDLGKFAIPRLQVGIRWWEDVISYNREQNEHLYTEDFISAHPITW